MVAQEKVSAKELDMWPCYKAGQLGNKRLSSQKGFLLVRQLLSSVYTLVTTFKFLASRSDLGITLRRQRWH